MFVLLRCKDKKLKIGSKLEAQLEELTISQCGVRVVTPCFYVNNFMGGAGKVCP